ncbi:hypothetical protein [Falsihalocynthiibacter arcticus]|uniref:Uncharacterized protein n=1 Tax=Falsihalocynthiibacter arcticus TaxID=1579316 RepID=A0A126V118_9RHOB|nr:hypothetical protein [Falsihalocynthiibacter arcticus]AML52032.1 hypothetical protein RC74_12795 [Falsihalocynthiibacter arcticus]
MKLLTSLTALLSATAISASAAYATTDIEKIEVEIDLTAIEDVEAAEVWNDIANDLETAIAKLLVDQITEEGATILIDIDEVFLANSLSQMLGVAETQLKGDVVIKEDDSAKHESFELTVTAVQAQAYYPEGTDVTVLNVGNEAFYNAMIDSFAEHVADKVK